MLQKYLKKLSPRQRQWGTIIVIGGVGLALVMVISYGIETSKAKKKSDTTKPSKKMTLLTERVEKDLWVAAEGQNIKALEKSNEEIRVNLEKLRREMEETREMSKKQRAAVPLPLPLPPPRPKKTEAAPPPLPDMPGGSTYPPSLHEARMPASQETAVKGRPGTTGRPGESGGTIRMFKSDEIKKQPDKRAEKDREPKTYLPAGSFMKAVLLSGLDAPTSGGHSSEPYPVLLGVTDISVLPNRFRMNLKECFIIGAGYGNISDERAYIRTETLSCVRTDHKVIETSMKGHVMGEDGKLGLRGRLVSKQGQQIAMAVFAGTLGGLGTALKPQQNISLNLLPTDADRTTGFSRPEFGGVMESAAMGGASKALDMVAQYYMKMAEKLFPIIEIDAGRDVEVVVLKGQELKLQGSSPTRVLQEQGLSLQGGSPAQRVGTARTGENPTLGKQAPGRQW